MLHPFLSCGDAHFTCRVLFCHVIKLFNIQFHLWHPCSLSFISVSCMTMSLVDTQKCITRMDHWHVGDCGAGPFKDSPDECLCGSVIYHHPTQVSYSVVSEWQFHLLPVKLQCSHSMQCGLLIPLVPGAHENVSIKYQDSCMPDDVNYHVQCYLRVPWGNYNLDLTDSWKLGEQSWSSRSITIIFVVQGPLRCLLRSVKE